jgi:hypothetical protein
MSQDAHLLLVFLMTSEYSLGGGRYRHMRAELEPESIIRYCQKWAFPIASGALLFDLIVGHGYRFDSR